MDYGFIKVASAIPGTRPGNCKHNAERIIALIQQAEKENVEIVCFPELSITGYTCLDLFENELLLKEAENSLHSIKDATKDLQTTAIIGTPLIIENNLMNCAVVIQKGKIMGIIPKSYLPNYGEFQEKRCFSPALAQETFYSGIYGEDIPTSQNLIFKISNAKFGVEIGKDSQAPIPRGAKLALAGADIIFNLSAESDIAGKYSCLKSTFIRHSERIVSGYVLSSSGYGESTQDAVFTGNAVICENGGLLAESKRFCLKEQLVCSEIDVDLLRHERRKNTIFGDCSKNEINRNDFKTINIDSTNRIGSAKYLSRKIDKNPFLPQSQNVEKYCEEILNIQAEGLAKRITHTKAKTVVIGISGGLDSTLALLVCAKAFDLLEISHENIIGITMPGFGTSKGTHSNAIDLMNELNVTVREISINDACIQHFKDIGHCTNDHDTTYENSQARERTQILMDVANQTNGLVIGTGDLSELALGWATYNGDHMSMYGVNSSIPKTLMQLIIKYIARTTSDERKRKTLIDIVNTPISPELIPTNSNGEISQKTEDKIGPYELHDFFIYYTLRYGFNPAKIFFLAKNAFCKKAENEENGCSTVYYTEEVIKYWLKTFTRRFFAQQFKRSCSPDGPKVTCCSLSPRSDWHMPSDTDATIWIQECEKL